MSYEIEIHKKAQKQLKDIKNSNEKVFFKIDSCILKLQEDLFFSGLWIKKLHGKYQNFFCVKVGKYRIKFDCEDQVVNIYDISLRKKSYK